MDSTRIWSANAMVRAAKAPRSMFAHLQAPMYQVKDSTTGKFHSSRTCRKVPRLRTVMSAVTVEAATITESKVCSTCVPIFAEASWRTVLEPAGMLNDLFTTARAATSALTEHAPPTLADLATLTGQLARYDTLRTELLDALADTGASADATSAARTWMDTVWRAAHQALEGAEPALAADVDREVREAAARLVGDVDDDFDEDQYPALADGRWQMSTDIQTTAGELLENALASVSRGPLDIAAVRSQVLEAVNDAEPERLEQIPDVPVPAGASLRETINAAWRAAARTELAALVDAQLGRYTAALADNVPTVLLVSGDLDDEAAGLLLRCPSRDVNGRVRAYLVPATVGHAVAATRTTVHVPAAPLPEPLPAAHTAADARAVLEGAYVTTLAALVDDLEPDDAVAAALGVVHDPARY